MNKPLAHRTVPANYYGVWRRSLLENAQGNDTSSIVFWMQTYNFHADIRIPAARPDFSAYSCLEECALNDLHWLAMQQGFYGVTNVSGDICQWHRQHDFQPKSGNRDIAKVAFTSADEMLETGIDENYLEIWHKLEGSHLNLQTLMMRGENRHGESLHAYLLQAGKQLIYVRPRSKAIPEARNLTAAIELYQPNLETLLDWLDFEITLGQMIDDENWQIRHSTHPFLEGKIMHNALIEKRFYV